MRKQYFSWIYLVTSLVLLIYGGFTLIRNSISGTSIPIYVYIMVGIGGVMLLMFLVLLLVDLINKKNKEVEMRSVGNPQKEEKSEEPIEKQVEKQIEDAPIEEKKEEEKKISPTPKKDEVIYETRRSTGSSSYSRYRGGSGYIKKVGYGPVLRVEGSRFLDMRTNTYYRIQDNYVYQDGSGVVFEINGKRIRDAFGGYLYEISGSNINKIYGGFFASISGSYITTYDLKDKYEMTDSFSIEQILVAVALIFGRY